MTLEEQIEDFLKFYSDTVPSPEHEPIRFQKFVDMYKFHRVRQKQSQELSTGKENE